jgi:hypothetical protein
VKSWNLTEDEAAHRLAITPAQLRNLHDGKLSAFPLALLVLPTAMVECWWTADQLH